MLNPLEYSIAFKANSLALTKLFIAEYVSEIDSEMAFKDDYFFLQSIGSKITEGMVENIIREWE